MIGRWNEASSRPLGQRRTSPRTRLVRAGFAEVDRASSCLHDEALSRLLPYAQAPSDDGGLDPVRARLVEEIGQTADPDLALLSLVRLASAVGPDGEELRVLLAPLGAERESTDLADPVVGPTRETQARDEHRRRLLAVLGASRALGDFLASHPDHLAALETAHAIDAPCQAPVGAVLEEAVAAVLNADDGGCARLEAATAAMRVAYRDRLLAIAADDLTSSDPLGHIPVVVERMTRLADAALEAGLMIARAGVGPRAEAVALAVIAMGKTGARELNYVSDVDVVYVVGPASPPGASGAAGGPVDEDELVRLGTELAVGLARATSATGREPPLWPLDTALRPEGKDGALVRTLESHVTYYERWASSWEFQALLKARPCAGDARLGAAYARAVDPFVWRASSRENFVDDARAMRRRVENESGRAGREDRRIKLGPGGLSDVEWTVQLLQMQHAGRMPGLRTPTTMTALTALREAGLVDEPDARALGRAWRLASALRDHTMLVSGRSSDLLPSDPRDLPRQPVGSRRAHKPTHR